MKLQLISTTADDVIGLADLKHHCRVDDDCDDSYLEGLRDAALEYIENETGQDFRTKTYDLILDSFPASIELPRAPLQSVTTVKYYDTDNVLQTVTSTDYYVVKSSKINAEIRHDYRSSWPSTYTRPDAVVIRFVVGHTTPPPLLKHVVKLLVGTWYELRQAEVVGTITTDVKWGVQRILDQLSTVMVA